MKCNSKEDFARYQGVWVLCECRDGQLSDASIELVSEARRLADKLGTTVTALLVGWDVAKHAGTLGGYGADKVIVCEHEALKVYTAEAYTAAVCQVVEKGMPDTLLVSATTIGRDLAPRCAARLKTGLNADCTLLHVGKQEYLDYLSKESSQDLSEIEDMVTDNQLKMTMPAFGGHLMATIVCPNYRPQMATVRPGVMQAGEYSEEAAARCVVETPEITITSDDVLTEVIETVKEIKNTVDLTGAKVIVAVGMGIKKDPKKGIELAEQLAEAFDGVVGATRDVVTEGWIDEDRMIGQTGKIVRPKLYIGLGVSGAIQHQGGMKDSEFIVAVNSDKRAPLFEIADCGLVGDLFDVVPAMLKALKED